MYLHLLVSVIITDSGLMRVNTGHLSRPHGGRLALFLTSLASLKQLPWTSGRIHVAFDSAYKEDSARTLAVIQEWFPRAEVLSGRLSTYQEWSDEVVHHTPTGSVVLLAANDDHALMPGASDEFMRVARALSESSSLECMGLVTHFPEVWAMTATPWGPSSRIEDDILWSCTSDPIGTCLVRSEFLLSWFESDFTGGAIFVRPDNPFGPSVSLQGASCVIPRREVMRHLDGYSHVGIRRPCSPLRPTVTLASVQQTSDVESTWISGDWPRSLRAWRASSKIDLIRTSTSCPSASRDFAGDVASLQAAFAHRWNFRHLSLLLPDRGRRPSLYRFSVTSATLLTPTCLKRAPRFLLDHTVGRLLHGDETVAIVARNGWRPALRRWITGKASRWRMGSTDD